MTINRSEQSLDQYLINEIAFLKREMNALKTRQLLGGDNLVILQSSGSTVDLSITAGSAANLQMTVLLGSVDDMMVFPRFSVWVYGPPNPTNAWLLPAGANVWATAGKKLIITWREDYSQWLPGVKNFYFTIHNTDSSAYDLKMDIQLLYPKVS